MSTPPLFRTVFFICSISSKLNVLEVLRDVGEPVSCAGKVNLPLFLRESLAGGVTSVLLQLSGISGSNSYTVDSGGVGIRGATSANLLRGGLGGDS